MMLPVVEGCCYGCFLGEAQRDRAWIFCWRFDFGRCRTRVEGGGKVGRGRGRGVGTSLETHLPKYHASSSFKRDIILFIIISQLY